MYKTSASTMRPRNIFAGRFTIDEGTLIHRLYHTTPSSSRTPWSSQYPGTLILRQPLGTYAVSNHFSASPLSVDAVCATGLVNKLPRRPFVYMVSLFFETVYNIPGNVARVSSLIQAS